MFYYTYILQSEKNGRIYKGFTQNIEKRVSEHNEGLVNYTSKYVPWKLIYFEKFETKREAILREKFFKSGKGREWIKVNLLTTDHPPKADRFES